MNYMKLLNVEFHKNIHTESSTPKTFQESLQRKTEQLVLSPSRAWLTRSKQTKKSIRVCIGQTRINPFRDVERPYLSFTHQHIVQIKYFRQIFLMSL